MKSVTIKHNGELLFKAIHRKAGYYEVILHESLRGADVDIRNHKNELIKLGAKKPIRKG